MSTEKIKKRERAIRMIQERKHFLKCPICSNPMYIDPSKSLTCKRGHSYDLSKKGTINFLGNSCKLIYSKELFEARNAVCEAGFYDQLLVELVDMISRYQQKRNRKLNILDIGCGEGSHISGIFRRVDARKQTLFIGMDISKDSINIAARNEMDIIWCVGDLAKLPFMDQSIDIALNIFSPANYGEFERVLKDDGIVIKVVPGSNYLKEIREVFYEGEEKSTYSNDRTLNYFEQKMEILDVKEVQYFFPVAKEMLSPFVQMTPLTWEKDQSRLNNLKQPIQGLTADFTIIIGKKKMPYDLRPSRCKELSLK